MPDITMVIDAQDAGHVQAWLNSRKSIEAYTATLGKVDSQQKINNASAKEFDQLQTQAEKRAKQVIDSLLTPNQKYHKSLEELNSLFSRNLLTQDQYLAKLKAEKAAFEALDPERQKAIQQQQALAAAIAKTTEQTRTPMERYKQQVKELNELLAAGLGQDAYNRKLRQYREELVRVSGRLDERKQKEREVKTVVEEQTASGGSGLATIATRLGGIAAGYVTVTAAVRGWMQSNQQAIEEAEKFATVHDEMFRRFNVQSGLRGLQGTEAKNRMLGIAEETGFLPTQTEQAATAMVSTGFKPEEASGGALRNFLNILNAQGLHHEAPQPLVESITQYLKSQGMESNTDNMGMLGVQLQSLKATKLKLTDMPQLAQVGADLKGKLTQPEQMAAFGTLTDTYGANIASTRMRDIFTNLATSGGKENAVKSLESMGMKPGDIDFVGEDFSTVMGRMQTGLGKLPEEERGNALATIVERANIGTFQFMMDNVGLIQERAGNLNQVDAFEADVAEGSSGRAKALTRQQVRREIRGTRRNQDGDLLIQEILDSAEEQGVDAFARDRTKGYFNTARYLGFAPKTAAGIATSLTSLPGGDVNQAMQRVQERQATALEQNNVLMQEQNDLLRNGGKKPDVAPPGQRPSSGRAQPKAQVP